MKWKPGIWLKKLTVKSVRSIDRDVFVFSFFLLLSFIFWYLNSLGKEAESDVRYPVRYINLPEGRVLTSDPPSKLNVVLKGPGYSILKVKLSGNRTPLVFDVSTLSYHRVPGSRTSNYYVLTSSLIPKIKNQLRAGCSITSIKPDSLFFSLDRIVSRKVKVTPDIEVIPDKQYIVSGEIKSKPDSVTIKGPKSILDTIRGIRTRYFKMKGINENITKSTTLVQSKYYSLSTRKVLVNIPVEQFTEAGMQVPVKILNAPDSLNIRIFPDKVSVKYLVATSNFKKAGEVPFEVVIDVSEINLDTADRIPVSFRNIPPFVTSLRVTPATVDFIIEKKSR